MSKSLSRSVVFERIRKSIFFISVSLLLNVFGGVATAEEVAVSFSGILSSGQIDTFGVFGPVGGDLSLKPFSVSFSYDSSKFNINSVNNMCASSNGCSYFPTMDDVMDISITINNITKNITNSGTNVIGYCAGCSILDIISNTQNAWIFLSACDHVAAGCDGYLGLDYYSAVYPNKNTTITDVLGPYSVGSPVEIYYYPSASDESEEILNGSVGSLTFLSPFLLGTSDLGTLNLATLLPKLSSLASAAATGLAADDTSAAIVVFPVSTEAPVTFTTNNGTTLLAYEATFMKHSPRVGRDTLTVNPVSVGSLLYAVALLQAPPAGVTPAYATPITVTAQQGKDQIQQATLPLVPPPVLLVHGLWGDETSLSYYENLLNATTPWSKTPGLIYATSYPNASSFASQASLLLVNNDVNALLADIQNDGVVAGRIDVIAHSMGGLIARNYSKYKGYISLDNRELGKFHTIITLDTPEDGSEIASYLWRHKLDVIADWAEATYEYSVIWAAKCGSALNSLETCLNNSGQSITGGAVEALIPGSQALKDSPLPNIPNANWKAIASINTSGLEKFGVQELINAIHPTPKGIPTINSILGVPNDDIVSVASQLSGSPPVQWTESGFAHAEIFGITKAVTNSPKAAAKSMCWLAGVSCAEAAEAVAYDPITDMPSNARLENCATVEQPAAGQINVGESLTLHIRGVGLGTLALTQRQVHGDGYRVDDEYKLGEPSWNGVDLRFVPRVIGNVGLDITATCADGGYAMRHVDIVVGVDSAKVTSLRADHFRRMVMPDSNSIHFLSPEITVSGLAQPVKVKSFATYRVIASGANPPITVDVHGQVQSVHAGEATIEVSFAGHSDQIAVLVR